MRNKRALILLAVISGCLLLFVWVENERAHARALRVLCLQVASDLLANTKSERVSVIDHWIGTNFSSFLAGSARLQAVKLGDKLSDFLSLQAHASARLCFTNQRGQYFEIRIRDAESKTNFEVVGVLISNPRQPAGTIPGRKQLTN